MKERVISSVVLVLILAAVVFFHNTILFNIVMAGISIIAVYELLNATKMIKNRGLAVIAAGFSVLLPFSLHPIVRPFVPLAVFALMVGFFLVVLKDHSKISFSDMSMSLMISLFVPLFFSSAIYLRDHYGGTVGLYYFALAIGSAWYSDTCAFFAGYFFGKTKLAPVISPKKTVEGAIGGVIGAAILNVLTAVIFAFLSKKLGLEITINYLLVAVVSPIVTLSGVMGDLVASVIKRQYKVKDYGHIMPGHGGIMDRFDSVLLTLPTVYILVKFIVVAV